MGPSNWTNSKWDQAIGATQKLHSTKTCQSIPQPKLKEATINT